MILLEAGLFNLLLKVRIISQIENGNALLSCYLTESTCRKHFKILIDSGYTKTTVIADPIFAANALFSGDFNHSGSSARSILGSFGSILQNGEAFNISGIDRRKHIQITEHAVYNNQRIVATGKRGRSAQADGIQSGRTVCSFLYGKSGNTSANSIERIQYLIAVHL